MDSLNDPALPQRPDHPDFWKLSNLILKYDGRMQEGEPGKTIEQLFEESISEIVDLDSVSYMAFQRALRVVGIENPIQLIQSKELLVAIAAAWLEGFVIGNGFED